MPNYTILIVDYEPRTIETLRSALERIGCRVEVALDGLSGMRAFRQHKPDLTLIEVMLPKMSGLEVCRELKKSDVGRDRCILIMTSRFRSRQHRHQATHEYKADGFIEKPITEDALLATMERHMVPVTVAPAPPAAEPTVQTEQVATRAETPASVAPAEPPSETDVVEAEIADRLDSILGDFSPDRGDPSRPRS